MFNPYNAAHVIELTIICIALAVFKFIILLLSMNSKEKLEYVFAYCDGSTSKVVSREYVSKETFDNYDVVVSYPVLNVGKRIIYFTIH